MPCFETCTVDPYLFSIIFSPNNFLHKLRSVGKSYGNLSSSNENGIGMVKMIGEKIIKILKKKDTFTASNCSTHNYAKTFLVCYKENDY